MLVLGSLRSTRHHSRAGSWGQRLVTAPEALIITQRDLFIQTIECGMTSLLRRTGYTTVLQMPIDLKPYELGKTFGVDYMPFSMVLRVGY